MLAAQTMGTQPVKCQLQSYLGLDAGGKNNGDPFRRPDMTRESGWALRTNSLLDPTAVQDRAKVQMAKNYVPEPAEVYSCAVPTTPIWPV